MELKLLFPLKKILLITLSIGSLISYPTLVLAQPHNSVSDSRKPVQKDPPDRGTPSANDGTGSRGDCIDKQDKFPLTRLVGSASLKSTVKEYPTLWVYLPYTRLEAPNGEFSLQDGDKEVYRVRFQLPTTPGIIGLSLPSTSPPLAVGKQYRWYFDINCPRAKASNESATPASLTGVVQRITPSLALENELKAAKTPLERINIYNKQGFWIESITELAQLRIKDPQNPNLQKVWIELLSQPQVGLENLATEPIIGNVTTNFLPK